MKKIMLFIVLAVFLASACSQKPAEKPEDLIGKGNPVESNMPKALSAPKTKLFFSCKSPRKSYFYI